MDKKITRRVVLGSIIGGLAAGPFIIRNLRKNGFEIQENREVDIAFLKRAYEPFVLDWNSHRKLLDVPIHLLSQPTVFSIKPNLSSREVRNFTMMETCFGGNVSSLDDYTGHSAMYFAVSQGSIKSDSTQNGTLVVNLFKRFRKLAAIPAQQSPDVELRFEVEEQALSPEEFRFAMNRAITSDNNEVIDPFLAVAEKDKTSPLAMDICSMIQFPYKRNSIQVGDSWALPETTYEGISLDAHVSGVAQISDFITAKCVAEKTLSYKEYLDYQHFVKNSLTRNSEMQKNEKKVIINSINEAIADIEKNRITFLVRIVSYIDINTGLTIRHEYTVQNLAENENAASSNFLICQVS